MPEAIQTRGSLELLQAMSSKGNGWEKFNPLFTQLFFSKEAPFSTINIALDELDIENVIMSPFCSPMVGSVVQRDKGYETRIFTPGYMKPKHVINPAKTLVRTPGEPLEAAYSPQMRCDKLRASALKSQMQAIKARIEWLAISAITTGRNTIISEGTAVSEIDWGINPTNIIMQSGGTAWSQQDTETFDPADDIELYCGQSAGTTNLCIMGSRAWSILRSFKKFRAYCDTRRGSNTTLELAVKDLGGTVSMKGYLGDMAILVYSGKYKEQADENTLTEKYFLEQDLMVFCNTENKGLTAFGAIQDQEAIRSGLSQNAFYPKNWFEQGDPGVEFMQTHSAPQPVPLNINNFVTVKVA